MAEKFKCYVEINGMKHITINIPKWTTWKELRNEIYIQLEKNNFSIQNVKFSYEDEEGYKIRLQSEDDFKQVQITLLKKRENFLFLFADTPTKYPTKMNNFIHPTSEFQTKESDPSDRPNYLLIDHAINCDGCCERIKGNRYKCLQCYSFDLCEECEDQIQKAKNHKNGKHLFVKLSSIFPRNFSFQCNFEVESVEFNQSDRVNTRYDDRFYNDLYSGKRWIDRGSDIRTELDQLKSKFQLLENEISTIKEQISISNRKETNDHLDKKKSDNYISPHTSTDHSLNDLKNNEIKRANPLPSSSPNALPSSSPNPSSSLNPSPISKFNPYFFKWKTTNLKNHPTKSKDSSDSSSRSFIPFVPSNQPSSSSVPLNRFNSTNQLNINNNKNKNNNSRESNNDLLPFKEEEGKKKKDGYNKCEIISRSSSSSPSSPSSSSSSHPLNNLTKILKSYEDENAWDHQYDHHPLNKNRVQHSPLNDQSKFPSDKSLIKENEIKKNEQQKTFIVNGKSVPIPYHLWENNTRNPSMKASSSSTSISPSPSPSLSPSSSTSSSNEVTNHDQKATITVRPAQSPFIPLNQYLIPSSQSHNNKQKEIQQVKVESAKQFEKEYEEVEEYEEEYEEEESGESVVLNEKEEECWTTLKNMGFDISRSFIVENDANLSTILDLLF